MKLICTQENLEKAVSYLERITGRQTNLPILGNFLLETEKGRLKISATNLEIGVIVYIGAKIEKEGKIAIPAKILGNFIHNLPGGDVVNLETQNQTLQISSSTYQMNIKGLDGKDFPIIPQYKDEYFFSFPAQALKNALSKLLFCVSLNESRLELTGVNIIFYPDTLHLAATDSFRLSEEIIPLTESQSGYDTFLKGTQSLIFPNSTLQEIVRVITPGSSQVKIALKENQVFFEVDGVQIISRVINGKYPDYKQIVPQSFSLQVMLDREEFQRAVKMASAFSSYNTNEVTLVFDPKRNECTITSISQEVGENKTVLKIEPVSGETPLTIVFNPRYVSEGIGVCVGKKILFCANTGTTPAALKMVSDEGNISEGYVYIMMPIRK